MDKVTICNLALGMLGMPQIVSLEEKNTSGNLCRTFYPVLRDRVLRDHAWSFATASNELQLLAEKSIDPDFPYVCALPGDVIRVLDLVGGAPYRKLGRRILVAALPATVVYTARIEDTSLYDETFCEALQYLLAAELAMSNTRDAQFASIYRQEYRDRLATARSIDSQENRAAMQNAPRRSNWLGARVRGDCERGFAGPVTWTEGNAGKQGE